MRLSVLLITLVFASTAHAQVAPHTATSTVPRQAYTDSVEPTAATPEAKVDQLMMAYDTDHTPGGVVAVVRNGTLAFARGYGMADLEQGVPNTPGTPYHTASVSKQFTAFAIVMLSEDGRLSLDDDVRSYLPEVPDFGETITLRHLLTHTSGLREVGALWVMAGGRPDDAIRQSDLMRLVERQRDLNYTPGSEFLYVNTGYLLLAEVVARVTGVSFGEWMRRRVFEPLGMKSTQIYDDHERLIKKRAYSYRQSEEGIKKAVLNFAYYGPTGLSTTAEDLARWLHNFHSAQVGGPAVIEQMQERGVLATGDTLDYALGLAISEHRGLTRINHFGIDAGYRAALSYYPEIDAGVIILANTDSFPFVSTSATVAEIFFDASMNDQVEAEPDGEGAVTVAADQLDAYVGTYAVEGGPGIRLNRNPYEGPYAVEGGPAIRFIREGDRLVVQTRNQPSLDLIALDDTLFRVDAPQADIRISFRVGPSGRAERGSFHQYGTTFIRRIEIWCPGPEALDAYAGRYYSPELETFYAVSVEDNNLVLKHRRHDDVRLAPAAAEDTFGGSGYFATVRFERNKAGVVANMRVSNGRVRNLRFGKQEPR